MEDKNKTGGGGFLTIALSTLILSLVPMVLYFGWPVLRSRSRYFFVGAEAGEKKVPGAGAGLKRTGSATLRLTIPICTETVSRLKCYTLFGSGSGTISPTILYFRFSRLSCCPTSTSLIPFARTMDCHSRICSNRTWSPTLLWSSPRLMKR